MTEETLDLLWVLGELESLLRQAHENHWADWVGRAHRDLAADDLHGIDGLLGAFSGAGSLNDVVVFFVEGKSSVDWKESSLNDRFDVLRARAYELARSIKRASDRRL